MTIRAKILTGFFVVALIGVILGGVGLVSVNRLTAMTEELYTLQTESTEVAKVLNAHYIWRQDLTETALTGQEFTGSLDPGTCALGTWLSSETAHNITDPEIVELMRQVKEPHDYIHTQAGGIVRFVQHGDSAAATADLTGDLLPKTQEVISILTQMQERFATLVNEENKAILDFGSMLNIVIIAVIAVAIVVCVLLALLITSSIIKPIKKVTEAAEKVAVGDLDISLNYAVNDQIGRLVQSFQALVKTTKEQAAAEMMANCDLTATVQPRSEKDSMSLSMGNMLSQLNHTVRDIRLSTDEVSTGASQIATGAQALATGSTQQAATVQQLSSTISEINSMAKGNTEAASQALGEIQRVGVLMDTCIAQMREMVRSMEEIDEKSNNISKATAVVNDIAFQTNILALNAAVEAARAGEHGKGFAVVAEEVRNLASKSAGAARETEELIVSSSQSVADGNRIVEQVNKSLQEVAGIARANTEIMGEVQVISTQQSEAMEQINTDIEQVAQVVQQNSATAQQSAAAAQEMSGQANLLHQLMARFKLKEEAERHDRTKNTPPNEMRWTSSEMEKQHSGNKDDEARLLPAAALDAPVF